MKNEFDKRREELLEGLKEDARGEHIPGPWRVSIGFRFSPSNLGVAASDGIDPICALSGCATSDRANATLIAAAPELLEALKGLRDVVTDLYKCGRFPAFEFVRAGNVIAKAEGRDG